MIRNKEFEEYLLKELDKINNQENSLIKMGGLLSAINKLGYAMQNSTLEEMVLDSRLLEKDITEDTINEYGITALTALNFLFDIYKKNEENDNVNNAEYIKEQIEKCSRILFSTSRTEDGLFVDSKPEVLVYYMNYETLFGGKEKYNDIIEQFNTYFSKITEETVIKQKVDLLCSVIDTMEVMEQPIYEIYHRLRDIFKYISKTIYNDLSILSDADSNTQFRFAYATLKACRMKVLQTERYEKEAEAIVDGFINSVVDNKSLADLSINQLESLILAYSEAIRNRKFQDYGIGRGGKLWS